LQEQVLSNYLGAKTKKALAFKLGMAHYGKHLKKEKKTASASASVKLWDYSEREALDELK